MMLLFAATQPNYCERANREISLFGASHSIPPFGATVCILMKKSEIRIAKSQKGAWRDLWVENGFCQPGVGGDLRDAGMDSVCDQIREVHHAYPAATQPQVDRAF